MNKWVFNWICDQFCWQMRLKGCKIIEDVPNKYTLIEHVDETIVVCRIPTKKDSISIYYVKNGKIAYRNTTHITYKLKTLERLLRQHRLRNYKQLFSSDDETKTYI